MKNVLEYKNFSGTVAFSGEDEVFFGKINGIRDVITFDAQLGTDGSLILSVGILINGLHRAAVMKFHTGLQIGIGDLTIQSPHLLVYPVPLRNSADLTYDLGETGRVSISLFDARAPVP